MVLRTPVCCRQRGGCGDGGSVTRRAAGALGLRWRDFSFSLLFPPLLASSLPLRLFLLFFFFAWLSLYCALSCASLLFFCFLLLFHTLVLPLFFAFRASPLFPYYFFPDTLLLSPPGLGLLPIVSPFLSPLESAFLLVSSPFLAPWLTLDSGFALI